MADVVQNLEFLFTVSDQATPDATKVTDSLQTVEASAVEAADGVNEALVEAVEFLTEAVDDLSANLTTTSDDLTEIVDVAEKSRGRILSLTGAFSFLKRAAGGFSIGAALGAGAGAGLAAFQGIARLLQPLTDLIGEVFGPALDVVSMAFKSQLVPIQTALVNLAQDVLPELMGAFQPLVVGVVDFIGQFASVLQGDDSPITGLLSALQTAFTELKPVLMEVFGVLGENARVMLPVISELATVLVRVLAPILTTVIKFIGDTVKLLAPFLQKLVTQFTPLIEQLGGELGKIIEELATQLLPILEPLLGAVLELLKPLMPLALVLTRLIGVGLVTTLKVLGPILEYIASLIEFLSGELAEALTPFIEDFSEWLNMVIDDAIPHIEVFTEMFAEFFDDAKTNFRAINRFFRALGRVISDVVSDIGEFFTDLWEDIKEGWQAVEDFFDDAVTVFENIWDDPLGALEDAFVLAFESIFGSFEEVTEDIKELWSGFLEFLGLSEFEEDINSALGAMLAAVMSPIETMKGFINEHLISNLNKIINLDLPFTESTPGSIANIGEIPRLQEGGIITGAEAEGGVFANVGEAGPEAVIPLRPDVLESLIPDVNVTMDPEIVAQTEAGNRGMMTLLKQLISNQNVTNELLETALLGRRKSSINQVS